MKIHIERQAAYSRKELLLRSFFGWLYILIPAIIVLLGYSLWVALLSFAQFFYGIFTGKLSRRYFDATMNILNLQVRVASSISNLVDGYPELSPFARAENAFVETEFIERPGRIRFLVRYFLGAFLLIPHLFVIYIKAFIFSMIQFVAFFFVLFSREYPEGMHEFAVDFFRESYEMNLYIEAMTEKYPKF